MTQRSIGIRDYLEFRDIIRNTAATSANDILTEFVHMGEKSFVRERDIGSRYRPQLFLHL